MKNFFLLFLMSFCFLLAVICGCGSSGGGDNPAPSSYWTKQFGTAADDVGYGAAVDSSNNIYVTGVGGVVDSLWQGTNAGVDDYSYQSHQLSLNYITMLPEAFSLSFDGSYSLKNYTNADSYTTSTRPTKRTDNILSVAATLSKTIFWELGLMLKASYLADNCNLSASQSALGYGSYTSNAVSLGVARAF